MSDRTLALRVISLLFLFALGFSLFVNIPAILNNFLFADQSVYFAMTQSIARDGDIEYERKDLVRYYKDFEAGPQGIFLKKSADGRVFFAKSWAYSLFASPFVRLFGVNGFPVFHSILLLLVLLMGFSYLALANPPLRSLLGILTFLGASAGIVYFVWISPDFFNFCLAFGIVFLWIYKIQARRTGGALEGEKPGAIRAFLLSDRSDYLAAFLAGIATFSKPPNVILMAPIFLTAFLGKKFKKSFLIAAFFLASAVVFFGLNTALTSEWNFMGGERKTFYNTFPFEKPEATFDTTGSLMTSEGYFSRMLIPVKFVIFNVFYYIFGRFTGLAWYYFPALLFLGLFLKKGAVRGKERWLLFGALTLEILAYILLMPTNYGGGGGSLANRYFMNIFPLFFFLPALEIQRKHFALAWIMAAVFISPILIAPFESSANPAIHAKRFPIDRLPLEMTQYNEFPTNTNPYGFRIPFGTGEDTGVAYFLNDNFHKRGEQGGTWTRGDKTLDMIFKSYFPLSRITVRLMNNPRRENTIRVTIDGKTRTILLQPKEEGTLEFPVTRGFQIESNYLHRIKIRAAKASRPYWEDEASTDRRNLGVFFRFELTREGGDR